MEIINKIVDFEAYCPKCQNRATAEEENPCYECLQSPVNIHTKEPVFFKEGKPIVKKDLRRKAR